MAVLRGVVMVNIYNSGDVHLMQLLVVGWF